MLKDNDVKKAVICTNTATEAMNLKDTFDEWLNAEFPFDGDTVLVHRHLEPELKQRSSLHSQMKSLFKSVLQIEACSPGF